VHDALLVEGSADHIEEVVRQTQSAMVEASRVILNGFELRSDAKIVVSPDRYMDPRGEKMWQTIIGIVADIESEPTLAESRCQDLVDV
jgi:DNA polymerase I